MTAPLRRLAALLLLAACGGGAPPPPAAAPQPARSSAPLDLGGQRVLVLPLQLLQGVPGTREDATREITFALGERDAATQWIDPERLRGALRRTPGYAQDPGTLPNDRFWHYQGARIMDPLASQVARYGALVDARLVLIPRAGRWVPWGDRPGGRVRLAAALVDARSGDVVWMGEADGDDHGEPAASAVASAAAALAARMVVPRRG